MKPVALTVAGSDSGGGAGIQADLKTMESLGVFGTSAITAITAQNTRGVDRVDVLSQEMVYAQIKSVATDFSVRAAKTGMLGNAAIIETVARAIDDFSLVHLVVDTVMVSKSGHRLLESDAELMLKKVLLARAYLITPNLPEAEALLGIKITSLKEMKEAAHSLFAFGPKHVLIKGGHLATPNASDVFFDGKKITVLDAVRIDTTSTHGTGCTLSAAIAAYLAKGYPVLDACRKAKEYLTQALLNAQPLGHGHGPVNHFWKQV
ncbi:MAG: Hydroxymethylpyrimidine/phosphomethylpyrimidine kinase [Turneriella sp.]|nr:Hydroxymethylpyrimidine/phosphomethylpyrimidine kinase [Turneriella sp.]